MKPTNLIHNREIIAAIRSIRRIRAAYFQAHPCSICRSRHGCCHREPGVTVAELERRIPPATLRAAREGDRRLATSRRIV
jgi:hypothetical protein